MIKLIIGTCSWKYGSWKRIINPGFGEVNYLEKYSKHYNSAEVDQWSGHFWYNKVAGEKTAKEYPKICPGRSGGNWNKIYINRDEELKDSWDD